MLTIRLDVEDLASLRFAYSPMLETVFSLRVWQPPHDKPAFRTWLQQTARGIDRLDWTLLHALRGPRGWVPDFITPWPTTSRPDVRDELETIRRTPPEVLLHDLHGSHGPELPDPLARLARHPEKLAGRIADVFTDYWHAVIAPRWPRMAALLQADITYRSHRIADGGAAALFADLDDHVTWSSGVIELDEQSLDADVEVSGRGLPLLPSIFPNKVTAPVDSSRPPALTYPVRGRSTLLSAPTLAENPLAALLGRTRAQLLQALFEPASTTQLAHAFQISSGAVNQHLAVLLTSGLLTRARSGHHVLYRHTPLAAALLRAHEQVPAGRKAPRRS